MAGRSFRCSGAVLINAQSLPFLDFTVDVNAFSMNSTIDVTLPRRMKKGRAVVYQAPDISAMMQQVNPLPITVRAGYEAGPTPDPPVPIIGIEQGYVDEAKYSYTNQSIEISARSSASIFQDIRTSDALPRNITGVQLAQKYFAQHGIPLIIGAPSPVNSGKSSTDALQITSTRDRTEWDEMSAAALDDGFILTVHNGVGYYGPPAANAPTKTITWAQRGGICKTLDIDHGARRSHNLQIQVVSIQRHVSSSYKIIATYGNASAQEGETLRFFIPGLNRPQCKQKAQAIYYDLARREFTGRLQIVPDTQLLQLISQYGANFSIALRGDVDQSHQLTYAVRSARLTCDMSNKEPSLLADLVVGNLNPVNEGAELD